MRFKRLKLGIALSVVLVVSVLGSSAATAAPPPPAVDSKGYDGFIDVIRGAGSDTTYPLMQEVEQVYNRQNGCRLISGSPQDDYNECNATNGSEVTTENWDHDVAVSDYPAGSGAGQRMLGAGTSCSAGTTAGHAVSYSRSSSDKDPLNTLSPCLTFSGYAKDAIAVLTFGGRPLNDFSQAQLQAIFTSTGPACTTRTWQSITGDPADAGKVIKVYGIQASSGTYLTFRNYLGADPNNCANAQVPGGARVCFENNVAACAGVDDPNAIWWGSFGDLLTFSGRRGSAQFNGVEGALPEESNIRADVTQGDPGEYAITRKLWHVNRSSDLTPTPAGGPAGASAAFREWICRNGGHGTDPNTGVNVDILKTQLISANNFVRTPLSQVGPGGVGRCTVE